MPFLLSDRRGRARLRSVRWLLLAALTGAATVWARSWEEAVDAPLRSASAAPETWRLGRSVPLDTSRDGPTREAVRRREDPDGMRLAGRVLDARGAAMGFAPIQIRGADSEERLFADAQGRFEARCADRRPRDVTACDPAGRLREATRLGVPPGTIDLELRLRPAPPLEVRVCGPGEVPLERFAVAVLSEAHRDALAFFGEAEHPGGALVLGAPGQGFLVEVRSTGYSPARLGPFSPGALPERIRCTLRAAGGVRGLVTADGRPVRGARVGLHPVAEDSDGLPSRTQREAEGETESGKGGAFSLSVERSGTYFLRVEAEGFAPAEVGPLELSSANDREAIVELDRREGSPVHGGPPRDESPNDGQVLGGR